MSRRLLVLLIAMTLSGAGAARADGQHDGRLSLITDDRISESSGLAASTRLPGVAYTVNDSGHDPVVFAVDIATGDVVGTTALDGVDPSDLEALAVGRDDLLYLADTGDNYRTRDEVALYALEQPGRGNSVVTPRTFRVRYESGQHDAETLLADPRTGRFHIVTKGLLGGSVYTLPATLHSDGVNVAREVPGVDMPGAATDGLVLPEGAGAVVRTYTHAFVYRLPGWRELASLNLPMQRLGESVIVRPRQRDLVIGSEGVPSALVAVPIPERVWNRLYPEPEPADDESVGGTDQDLTGPGPTTPWGLVLALMGGVAVLGVVSAVLARRSRRTW